MMNFFMKLFTNFLLLYLLESLNCSLKILSKGYALPYLKRTIVEYLKKKCSTKVRLSYHLCVECFSQLSFDSEVYTKSAAVADFVYTSETSESCEKHSTQR